MPPGQADDEESAQAKGDDEEQPAGRNAGGRAWIRGRGDGGGGPSDDCGAASGDLVVADRVVRQTAKGDCVAKGLEEGDFGVPDDDGNNDEEDILEDAGEGHDEAGSLANLRHHC